MLSCIVNLPEEGSVSLTKRVGENKTVLQLQKFADMLPTSSVFVFVLINIPDSLWALSVFV